MTATISRLYNSYADAKEAVRNLEAAGSRTTTFLSSQATPTIGTRPTTRGSRVRSRIVISTARMTALRQQVPAPASARPWVARRACSQGLA